MPVRHLLVLLIALAASPAVPALGGVIDEQGLGLPLTCTLGRTCWVAKYVDVDPSGVARDFRCKPRTLDGHKGTDFAIRDLAVMAQGVPVVASAAGTVKNVRDGVEDLALTDQASRDRIKGRECGNGVVIDHAGDWQTQYCHLRQGSLTVKVGDRVERGSQLGLIGLSGETEFPHVHLTVRKDGKVVDPFTGQAMTAGCGLEAKPLWQVDQHIEYEPVALYNAGFSTGKPDIEAIRSGKREDGPLAATSPALVLWVDILGVEAGDRVQFRIVGPDGKPLLEQESPVDRTQARRFAFAGKKLTASTWPAGTYQGQVTLIRTVGDKEWKSDASRTVTIR